MLVTLKSETAPGAETLTLKKGCQKVCAMSLAGEWAMPLVLQNRNCNVDSAAALGRTGEEALGVCTPGRRAHIPLQPCIHGAPPGGRAYAGSLTKENCKPRPASQSHSCLPASPVSSSC